MSKITTPGLYLPMIIAGFLITMGVSMKNSPKLWTRNMKTPGMLFFILGWILAGFAFVWRYAGDDFTIGHAIWFPIIGIVVTAILMNKSMTEKKPVSKFLPMIFIASWILFGTLISIQSNDNSPAIAVGLVFYSMFYLLPLARKNCSADSLGMPFFFIAWMILSMALSQRKLSL